MNPNPKPKKRKKEDVDWAGFAFPKLSKRLSPYKYSKLKRQVHALDGWRCVNPDCTETYKAKELHLHHIIPRGRFRLDTMDNGVTLCFACHRLVEDKLLKLDFEKIIERRKLGKEKT